MSFVDDIEKLNNLRESGAISEQEYLEAKESLLAKNRNTVQPPPGPPVTGVAADPNMWGMFIHLAQFSGFVVPLAGLIVPIILWQIKKDESNIIDRHGKVVTNWIITEVIFGIVFAILCIVFIGIPLLLVLGVVSIVFPIIGAVKANNGEVWVYPCSIKFFPLDNRSNTTSG